MDKSGESEYSTESHKKAREIVKAFMEQNAMIDVWRLFNPDCRKYSWSRAKPQRVWCRLDFFLVADSLVNRIKGAGIHAAYKSDHDRISIDLVAESEPRGRGFWKLNTLHLQQEEFYDLINAAIDQTIETEKDMDPLLQWEGIKNAIASEAVAYSKREAKKKNLLVEKMTGRLDILKSRLVQAIEEKDEDKIEKTQESINKTSEFFEEELEKDSAKNAFKSKARWYQLGEKNNAYFLSLQRRNYHRKHMIQIEVQGNLITNPKQILIEQGRFYKKLFATKETEENLIMPPQNINPNKKLSNLENARLESEITLGEVAKAIKNMPNGKTPGADGIPVEVYKAFWPKIGTKLHQALLFATENKRLHQSARYGILSLIPKKERDTRIIGNWRPIMLLNIDYKTLAKLLV